MFPASRGRVHAATFAVVAAAVSALTLTSCSSAPIVGSGSVGGSPSASSATVGATPAGGTPSSTPTGMPRTDPIVFPYSLPPGAVEMTPSGDLGFSRMEGVLAVPSTPGRHPVAIIVHGSYVNCIWREKDDFLGKTINTVSWVPGCGSKTARNASFTKGQDYVRWSASFAFLAKQLAARGIAAVAIDVAIKDSSEFGEPDAAHVSRVLLDLHRRLLTDLNSGKNHGLAVPVGVAGSLDLDRVAVIGHSSGGGFATAQLTTTSPVPGLAAVVALQPAADVDESTGPLPRNTPALFVSSTCDEQASASEVRDLAKGLGGRTVGAPMVLVNLAAATHIAMIGGGDHTRGMVRPVEAPECATAKLAVPGAVRMQTASVIGDFLETVFAGEASFTFHSGTSAPVTAALVAGKGRVATTTVADGSLGTDLSADAVRFVESTEQFLPPFTRPLR